jgi:hypothetical protein
MHSHSEDENCDTQSKMHVLPTWLDKCMINWHGIMTGIVLLTTFIYTVTAGIGCWLLVVIHRNTEEIIKAVKGFVSEIAPIFDVSEEGIEVINGYVEFGLNLFDDMYVYLIWFWGGIVTVGLWGLLAYLLYKFDSVWGRHGGLVIGLDEGCKIKEGKKLHLCVDFATN